MKTLDVIEIFDKIRPNSFDFASKRAWVNSIETDIRRFGALHREIKEDMSFLNEENPTLFLDENYADVYVYYLVSMGDMTNGEFRLYNISSSYFNSIFEKWKKEYRSFNIPLKNTSIKI
ncbi:MAG: hypothetical protein J6V03_00445 [Clostridia bacterium]|nr:hypothetical protein [Clostridia bacterium]